MSRLKHGPVDQASAYAKSLGLVLVATAVSMPLRSVIEPVNLVMVYLAAVVVSAIYLGYGPSVVTSVAGVLAFDVFCVEPYLSLAIKDGEYALTFMALLGVGVTISSLTERLRVLTEESNELRLLKAKEELQSALLNSVSHELRTPLTTIVGALSSLAEAEATPNMQSLHRASRAELIEAAREEADRLSALVSGLLDMSRIESGSLKVNHKPNDIQDIVGSSIQQVRRKHKKCIIKTEIPVGLPLLNVDFVLISQAFSNILDNAIKYSPAGEEIQVKVRASGRELQMSVLDRGSGIPEADLNRVFAKFYRVPRSERTPGTGLGLAIAKGFIEAHGGKIRAENREGGGTAIIVSLPLEPSREGQP
ncbi:MAG: ATP-binding protein [Bacillota bacterium]